MKPTGKQSKVAKYIFWAIVIFIVSWIVIWGDYSFLKTYQLQHSVEQLRRSVNNLQATNDSLRQENERLKTSPEAAEKAARERFGLTKPGEKVFRFVPSAEQTEEARE